MKLTKKKQLVLKKIRVSVNSKNVLDPQTLLMSVYYANIKKVYIVHFHYTYYKATSPEFNKDT